jgi:3-phenylpropionate/trans-cinnamate dioxygenase ferredoxin reductase component
VLKRIVVVGAALAGLRAAETLRREGFDGTLTVIGAEPHLPYDRPPLSKQLLTGEWDTERTWLRPAGFYADLQLDLMLGAKATALDTEAQTVSLAGGGRVPYDGLVIATGSRSHMPDGWQREGVCELRTLDEAMTLRARFAAKPRLVVVGGGFIGCEVAAAARHSGVDVTVVEMMPSPLHGVLGQQLGTAIAGMHQDEGVSFRFGVRVAALEGGERVERVRLSDGTAVDADLVVVGVGARPATGWLAGSGLQVGNGIVCDSRCAAAGNVVAAGDVACWFSDRYGRHMRVEHWTNASEQGIAAARRLLHGETVAPYQPVPYFWSDQYDLKLQVAGWPSADSEVVIAHGRLNDRRFVALYGSEGKLTAVVTGNWPRRLAQYRRLLMQQATWEEALRAGRVTTGQMAP